MTDVFYWTTHSNIGNNLIFRVTYNVDVCIYVVGIQLIFNMFSSDNTFSAPFNFRMTWFLECKI